MSIRRGYWWLAGETFDGPFPTIKEAKANASQKAPSVEVSIRTMIAVERYEPKTGEWKTVH